jgi:CubicO group peptidase (beta-lactamase class C family)
MPPAAWPTEGWPIATPEELGMSSGVLADLVLATRSIDNVDLAAYGIDSVTVVRNGYVVLDTVIYPFPEETAHNTYSCTKSIIGTLIGIATDQGLIAGVDVPVVELLPEAAPDEVDELKAAMTVEDLLTMTSGLDCRDSYKYDWRGLLDMEESDNWAAHVLALPMSEEPGTRFEYCNGASYLLSAILTEVTGKPAAQYADEVLFEPLGITDYVWPAGPDGTTIGWADLELRPADMAKIGYLYLRNGEWDGDQIVSSSWTEAATTAYISAGTLSDGYGYQWWVDDAGYVMALGYGGQYITVIPSHDLVVVFTSGLLLESLDVPEDLTNAFVLPAVVSDDPLAPDPEASARLAAVMAAARSGPEPEIVALPDIAFEIDGVRFGARENEVGLKWVQVDFGSDVAMMTGEGTWGSFEYAVGLDGRYRVNDDSGRAYRGAWRTEDTFVLEGYGIGWADRMYEQWVFDGDTVTLLGQNLVDRRDFWTITADRAN